MQNPQPSSAPRGLFSNWRLSTKLVVAMLLLALVPVLIVSTAAYATLRSSLTAAQQRALASEAIDTATTLETILEKNLALTTYTARNEALIRYAKAAPEERGRYKQEAEAQLKTLQGQDDTFEVAGLIDLNGEFVVDQVAPNIKTLVGVKVPFRDYFQRARDNNPFISNIQVSTTTNKPSLYCAAPVRDGDRVVGVLALRINPQGLQDAITNVVSEETKRRSVQNQEVIVIDNQGIILLHSSKNETQQYRSVVPLTPAQQEEVSKLKRFGNNVQQVEALNVDGFGPALEAGQADSFTYTLDGETQHASMAPVKGVPWRIVTTVPESAFTGPIVRETQRNLALAFGLMLIVIPIALFLTRQITRPLNELRNAASRIAAGNYDVRAPVRGRDELGQVAQAVNGMVDQITETTRQREAENIVVQRQIVGLLDDVSKVAGGDLTVEAEVSADALGSVADSFNYMTGELRQVIGRVNDATTQVTTSTDEILATTDVLARSAEQQAGRIADTSTAVEEMAVSIQQVSENAAISAQVAREARTAAEAGAQAVTDTVAGMGRIRGQVQETAKKIKRLGESSQEIGQAVQLIEEIAKRTNRLALNAAIQAAMAGEHGKGFAVVAEEVRRLAERTGAATGQIAELVSTIQSETAGAVVAMEDGTREVVGGSRLADEAGRSLQQIDQIVGQLAELIEAISLAAEQQARASTGIAQAMGEISQVTQTTTTGTQQASQSVAALAGLASDLRDSVAAFRLDDAGITNGNGNARHTGTRAAPVGAAGK